MSRDEFFEWLETCPSDDWFIAEDGGDGLRVFFCVDDEEDE